MSCLLKLEYIYLSGLPEAGTVEKAGREKASDLWSQGNENSC